MAIDVSKFVCAAGGAIVGKIRFQKMVYILDQLGLESGFEFDYHHYGPYSSVLADAVDIEAMFGGLTEDTRRRQTDGVPYSVFKYNGSERVDFVGGLTSDKIQSYSSIMDRYSATALELAATAYWLVNEEGVVDWRPELIERKGVKTDNGRADEAVKLLSEIGLKLP